MSKTKSSAEAAQAADTVTAAKLDNPPFEDRLARLEEISDTLRKGQIGLEAATGLFEEGIKLAQGLEKELARVERRVEILVNEPSSEGETPVLELFPELKE